MGIEVIWQKPARHQPPLAVIAPALVRRASACSYCIPRIDSALHEAQGRVDIRIAGLRHLCPWWRWIVSRCKICRMAVAITSVFVHDKFTNKSRVLVDPLHLGKCGHLSAGRMVAREVPIHAVHVPPLGREEEDRPGKDPEESDVEDVADPAGAPAINHGG
jgi:hypothetical protein